MLDLFCSPASGAEKAVLEETAFMWTRCLRIMGEEAMPRLPLTVKAPHTLNWLTGDCVAAGTQPGIELQLKTTARHCI